MVFPINTFTIHSLISFTVTASLAAMFYIVYLKAGRRKLDLLSANFIMWTAGGCLLYFLMDNLVPAGMSSWGWPGGPTTGELKVTTLELYRLSYAVGIILVPVQLHFVLYYCRKDNFIRRHIGWAYVCALLVLPTVWTSLWCSPIDKPISETAGWGTTLPWMPNAGPAVPALFLSFLSVQVYGLVQIWKTRGTSVEEFNESLGGRVIVFAAFVVQVAAGLVDVVNGALGMSVPASSPVGSGIMGVLLATALIRSRMESDRRKAQLEREKAGLLECVPQPLLYVGPDLKIQWTNGDAPAFAGKTTGELVGRRADEVWSADARELVPVREAMSTGLPATCEVSRRDEEIWMVSASPVTGTKGESLGAIVLATDITEIRMAQKAMEEANVRILNAREEERRRVAQDLHDSIAQGLTAMQMTLRAQAEEVGLESREGQTFDKASQRAGQIGSEVRQISHQLYPPALDLLGMAAAIEEIFDPYVASGIKCSLDCPDDLYHGRFSQTVEVSFYRTVQEAISNAVRHGKAGTITVKMEQTEEVVRVTVIDDGCGFDVKRNSKGLGMTSMTGRIDGVGGRLEITSRPGRTCVGASVPLEKAMEVDEAEAVATAGG
jgi:PAS domain S-box-containing protein